MFPFLQKSSVERRDMSREEDQFDDTKHRIRGAKRGSTNRRKIRHSRHLATANRRIKRTAERGASGPQMPHPSLWPHIDRGAAYHRRSGAKYSRTCDAHVCSIRRHERGIELSKGNTAVLRKIYFRIFRVFLCVSFSVTERIDCRSWKVWCNCCKCNISLTSVFVRSVYIALIEKVWSICLIYHCNI